jgi:TPR repeat protein
MLPPAWLYSRSLEYLDGKGIPKDERLAFVLNQEAAEQGYGDAVLAMGWFYLNGVGVDVDLDEAERWYRKSARQGDPSAMFSLGQIAYNRHSYGDALTWLKRATDKGHSRSLFWLGKLNWHGRGVARNKKQAMTLFQKAAAKKVREAQRAVRFLARTRGRFNKPLQPTAKKRGG